MKRQGKLKMINLDELTIGQLKEIKTLLNDRYEYTTTVTNTKQHPFIGKFVLCRCYSAGVHAGYLEEIEDDKVILSNSRRLWTWKGTGVALSGVANGDFIDGKLDTINPEIYLTGVIEVIPCCDKTKNSILPK